MGGATGDSLGAPGMASLSGCFCRTCSSSAAFEAVLDFLPRWPLLTWVSFGLLLWLKLAWRIGASEGDSPRCTDAAEGLTGGKYPKTSPDWSFAASLSL